MKNQNIQISKITKVAFAALLTIAAACTKNDDTPTPAAPDNKLVLPADFQNATGAVVQSGIRISATGPNCGQDILPGTAESVITITKDGIIGNQDKVFIELDLSDAAAGEVVVQLTNPAGESTSLIKRIGATTNTACGSDRSFVAGNILSFNTANTTVVSGGASGLAIPTDNYNVLRGTNSYPTTVPDNALLSILKDKSIKGDWKLKVYDYGQANLLALVKWKITFATGALK